MTMENTTPVNCTEAVHELYSYLDGELTDSKRQAIKDHLQRCRPCDRAVQFEAELLAIIGDRCAETIPDDLTARVKAALEEAKAQETEPS